MCRFPANDNVAGFFFPLSLQDLPHVVVKFAADQHGRREALIDNQAYILRTCLEDGDLEMREVLRPSTEAVLICRTRPSPPPSGGW